MFVQWLNEKKVQELLFYQSILCLLLRCALADRLLRLLLKPGYLVSFIDIFSTEGEVTELIPFCNFLTHKHCAFLRAMPQPLASDCCQGSLMGWRKAGEAAQ